MGRKGTRAEFVPKYMRKSWLNRLNLKKQFQHFCCSIVSRTTPDFPGPPAWPQLKGRAKWQILSSLSTSALSQKNQCRQLHLSNFYIRHSTRRFPLKNRERKDFFVREHVSCWILKLGADRSRNFRFRFGSVPKFSVPVRFGSKIFGSGSVPVPTKGKVLLHKIYLISRKVKRFFKK